MINRVILVGNLTRDAETLTTTGRAMAKLRLATNSRWRSADGAWQESVEFHTVIAFGGLAETATLYCTKGRRIYVEGKLRTRRYNAADGSQRTATEVVADTVKLLQSRTDADGERADGERAGGEPIGDDAAAPHAGNADDLSPAAVAVA